MTKNILTSDTPPNMFVGFERDGEKITVILALPEGIEDLPKKELKEYIDEYGELLAALNSGHLADVVVKALEEHSKSGERAMLCEAILDSWNGQMETMDDMDNMADEDDGESRPYISPLNVFDGI